MRSSLDGQIGCAQGAAVDDGKWLSHKYDLAQAAAVDDWKWQLRHAVRRVDALGKVLHLSSSELDGARRAERAGLPLALTPYLLALCHPEDPSCPMRRQLVPRIEEQDRAVGELRDPLGEEQHQLTPDLIRRYPDRALYVANHRCAAYCRFCTRSRVVGRSVARPSPDDLGRALDALRRQPAIREVIVSGGDPLVMATRRLVEIVGAFRSLPQIEVIRLATRAPSTLPQRITDELLQALKPHHPLWVMTHFNHPRELTPQAARACLRLVEAGFPVMNQTVLLRGVNDAVDTLRLLFRGLVQLRVRPYYLLLCDPVWGTGHLRTPLATGVALMEQLQGHLSGIALPKLIVDTPGGFGKVPVGPDYVVARGPGATRLRTHRGVEVDYRDPEEPK